LVHWVSSKSGFRIGIGFPTPRVSLK
jgi:hypothetical protein